MKLYQRLKTLHPALEDACALDEGLRSLSAHDSKLQIMLGDHSLMTVKNRHKKLLSSTDSIACAL